MAELPILSIREGQISFADKLIFRDLEMHIYPRDRICLVGRNGAGKSTLFKSLMKLVQLDKGEYFEKPSLTVAYLPQEVIPQKGMTAVEYVEKELMQSAEPGTTSMRHIAEKALDHIGVPYDLHLEKASGGEIRRVGLASVLVQDVDLLLLDEPTNHLDVAMIQQLEEDIKNFRGAVVVVSHDRTFLENVSTKTWWLNRKTLSEMRKGFKHFEEWQEEVTAEETRRLEKLDTKLAQEAHWLHRGVTARRKRNQGRLKRLQELRVVRSTVLSSVKQITIDSPEIKQLSGKLVIEAEGIEKKFGDRTVIKSFSTKILRGDRIGIFGPNGSGKSTLIKMLIGEIAPSHGRVRVGSNLSVGYFEQQHHDLNPTKTLWDTLCPQGGDHIMVQGRYKHVVAYLKDFLFDPEQAKSYVATLSGGERNRLALAKLFAEQHNFLVLDEPTNDLDMDTLDLLIDLLSEYDGTLMVVSHDRDFLDKLVTSTISIEGDGTTNEYAGGYTDHIFQRNEAMGVKPAPKVKKPAPKKEEAPRPTQPKRFGFKEQHRLKEINTLMPKLEAEAESLEQRLHDTTFATTDYDGFLKATERYQNIKDQLAKMEEEWLNLEMERDAAESKS